MAYIPPSVLVEQFSKINLLHITDVELARWVRTTFKIGLAEAFGVARLIRAAHGLGEQRGRALR